MPKWVVLENINPAPKEEISATSFPGSYLLWRNDPRKELHGHVIWGEVGGGGGGGVGLEKNLFLIKDSNCFRTSEGSTPTVEGLISNLLSVDVF